MEIVVNVLDREVGVDRDVALVIAGGVFNKLKSPNISSFFFFRPLIFLYLAPGFMVIIIFLLATVTGSIT
jgi:hypothetical protein